MLTFSWNEMINRIESVWQTGRYQILILRKEVLGMARNRLKVLLIVAIAAVLVCCAAQKKTQPTQPAFEAYEFRVNEYNPKVDIFMVILDASATMAEGGKFQTAREVASRMNQTIPDIRLVGALRTLGQSYSKGTVLAYGPTSYIRGELEAAIWGVRGFGKTALDLAVDAASDDLKSTVQNIAVIILSDGKETDDTALTAAKEMKRRYGDRLCIYSIVVGDDPAGSRFLEQIAEAGECGLSVNAKEIMSSQGMAGFVEEVFLEKKLVDSDGDGVVDDLDGCPHTPLGVEVDARGCPLDSDGDGITDYLDQCPDTPAWVFVDDSGCPLDSDGDGVPDYLDQCLGTAAGVSVDDSGCPLDSDGDGVPDSQDRCPDTPKGATINDMGCWAFEGLVLFVYGKYDIKPEGYPILDEVVSVLKQNPEVKLEIQGHTDSIGSAEYNQRLSENRAKAVMDYLVRHGIEPGRLRAKGYGFTQPVALNDTEEGRAKNRRVELKRIR